MTLDDLIRRLAEIRDAAPQHRGSMQVVLRLPSEGDAEIIGPAETGVFVDKGTQRPDGNHAVVIWGC